ncbi:TPA: hypothetical protein N0F65_004813 [Lagenidium giganteum]|uniref:Retrovirus-related Pol polyprotein from transposon TNT 1-94-like beta-barrel domain-containing protein n=1 Tax=Lagenidium giganteum TaxID=4803 RepID=A0AAV2ZAA9_9STRA|nr:TPA: hypothetical protein N0F65_004813 [Lagenidium giganteum]
MCQKYQSKTWGKVVAFHEQFTSIRYEDGTNLQEHLNKLDEFANKLEYMEKRVGQDKRVCCQLSTSLPATWNNFKLPYLMNAKNISWEAMEGQVITEHYRHCVIDSGCSHDMCRDQGPNGQVTLAKHATAPSVGIGKVVVNATAPTGKVHAVLLTRVYHVPSLKNNLLSVAKVAGKGGQFDCNSNPNVVVVKIAYRGVAVECQKSRGPYILNECPRERELGGCTANIEPMAQALWSRQCQKH